MTLEEFQNKYHDYIVENEMDAVSDALKINTIAKDFQVKPMKFLDKYCLMEVGAASFISDLGI